MVLLLLSFHLPFLYSYTCISHLPNETQVSLWELLDFHRNFCCLHSVSEQGRCRQSALPQVHRGHPARPALCLQCKTLLRCTWISSFRINEDPAHLLSSLGICRVWACGGLTGQAFQVDVSLVRNGVLEQRCLCCGTENNMWAMKGIDADKEYKRGIVHTQKEK